MSNGTHLKGPLTVAGVEVVNSSGAITADIQAAEGSIGSTEIADGAITSAKLGAKAVGSAAIADDAITSAKIEEGVIQTAIVTLTADKMVGTGAGCIGHADGAVLVAAPGEGKCLEFVSAVLSYTFNTAAYTGGGDDLVVRQGTTSVSAAIASADLIGDSANDYAYVGALSAADIKLTANSNLNLKSTAWTNPGTAAGTLRYAVSYRVHSI